MTRRIPCQAFQLDFELDNATMEPLANDLAGLIGEPVIDGTGLEGRYKISLHVFIGSPMPPDQPDLFEALEDQLALKLVPQKRSIEVLVIDYIDKSPTEN
jgi:uncharacterized protein (TIGR03435 family)